MGKNSNELWDDSALIDAFDNAVSKYKKMHSKGRGGVNSANAGEEKNVEQDGLIPPEKTEEEVAEPSERSTAVCSSVTTACKLGDDSGFSNMAQHLERSISDQVLSANHTGDSSQNETTTRNPLSSGEIYIELLAQYHNIENQRQTLLHQLHQASYGYSHQHPATAADAVLQGDPSACSGMSYSYGGYQSDQLLPSCSYPHGFHASTAPRSVPMPCATTHQVSEEKETNAETQAGFESLNLRSDMQTDLSTVLTAWYSAGFHTGRYLLEQSLKKDQR